MKQVEEWLATTATGSFIKIGGGAALGALLSWLLTADVHPLVVAIGAAVIPIAVNTLNPKDSRYGKTQKEEEDNG